jgi:hypothetical protein
MDASELAKAYLRHFDRTSKDFSDDSDDLDDWAWEDVYRLRKEGGEPLWTIIDHLIEAAQSIDHLGYIGAGPLEDLLRAPEAPVIERLKSRVETDLRWAFAARMINAPTVAPSAARVVEALDRKYPDERQFAKLVAQDCDLRPPSRS